MKDIIKCCICYEPDRYQQSPHIGGPIWMCRKCGLMYIEPIPTISFEFPFQVFKIDGDLYDNVRNIAETALEVCSIINMEDCDGHILYNDLLKDERESVTKLKVLATKLLGQMPKEL